jgi:hypothetical protein
VESGAALEGFFGLECDLALLVRESIMQSVKPSKDKG